jgi:hypothetical protein
METYEIAFPLKHPPYIIDDVEFRNRIYRIMAKGHPIIRFYRKVESIILRIKNKDFNGLKKSLNKKMFRKSPK